MTALPPAALGPPNHPLIPGDLKAFNACFAGVLALVLLGKTLSGLAWKYPLQPLQESEENPPSSLFTGPHSSARPLSSLPLLSPFYSLP